MKPIKVEPVGRISRYYQRFDEEFNKRLFLNVPIIVSVGWGSGYMFAFNGLLGVCLSAKPK
jgi:CRISPR/Cas system CSM-associated protein Csm5 (group 7 of RAMP superfamily)